MVDVQQSIGLIAVEQGLDRQALHFCLGALDVAAGMLVESDAARDPLGIRSRDENGLWDLVQKGFLVRVR